MKLKIYEKPKEQDDIIVQLMLVKNEDAISLVTINDNGVANYYLLTILPNGKFERHVSVPLNIGFQVDEEGRIKEEE